MAAIVLLLTICAVAGVGLLDGGAPAATPSPGPTVVLSSGPAFAAASVDAADGGSPLRLPILMYRHVGDGPPPAVPPADGLSVRTDDFRAEMAHLTESGYRAVLLEDLAAVFEGAAALPAGPLVALTFDDGGLDNYTVAYPILREFGLVATFFVVTEKVGGEGHMTWGQLEEMRAAGMSVQSLTRSHPDLTGLDPEALHTELTGSRTDIEEKLGGSVRVLCYPSGSYDDVVVDAARAAGYALAVTTTPGKELDPGSPLALPRMLVPASASMETFAESLR